MEYSIVKTDEEPVESYLVLDRKIANLFHSCAKNTKEYPNDYGEMRRLKIELQNLCGITELEAFNVLIYRNVSDYIGKYSADAFVTSETIAIHNQKYLELRR